MNEPEVMSEQEMQERSRRYFETSIIYDPHLQHVYASKPEHELQDAELAFSYYQHLAVNFTNGSRLLFPRSTRVRVYAVDIRWKFGFSADAVITTPTGHGGAAPSDWRFPGMPHFGIILYQDNGTRHSITGTSASNAQVLDVSNGYDIKFAVNDRNGTYEDNSGAYSIFIEQVQP